MEPHGVVFGAAISMHHLVISSFIALYHDLINEHRVLIDFNYVTNCCKINKLCILPHRVLFVCVS
jgi:hypothetical protein